ncbi:hypothetical protein RQP54_14060 [Curvibacter sp. APW13]|uniref:hypothetical protein n=1 Tax=Curvibacter sp. APW13 TaxID=3077236 RepID=UPI0028E04591|nr:hypothetical protein [Curvibacter sp. APW13]MDT8991992.1 hypothetical protein [Curvibacter sp. APW13]
MRPSSNEPLPPSNPRRFAPHGQASFHCEGRRLVGFAQGPFNVELARHLDQQIVDWCRRLCVDGPFDHLCVFRGSVLLGPEPMREFQRMLERLSGEGIAPQRMAYVIAPDVEGGTLLGPQLTQAYAAAGLNMRIFPSEAAALAWLDSVPSQP